MITDCRRRRRLLPADLRLRRAPLMPLPPCFRCRRAMIEQHISQYRPLAVTVCAADAAARLRCLRHFYHAALMPAIDDAAAFAIYLTPLFRCRFRRFIFRRLMIFRRHFAAVRFTLCLPRLDAADARLSMPMPVHAMPPLRAMRCCRLITLT